MERRQRSQGHEHIYEADLPHRLRDQTSRSDHPGDFQGRLYEYIGGIIRAKNGHLIEVGGIADHVHIATHLSPKFAISDMIRNIKGSSSMWANSEQLARGHFEWQKGYGAFTVSHSNVDSVQRYIQNQEEHHQKKTFEDEYIEFLNRHQIAFKRGYLFEEEHHG